jgi:hypothetical protein
LDPNPKIPSWSLTIKEKFTPFKANALTSDSALPKEYLLAIRLSALSIMLDSQLKLDYPTKVLFLMDSKLSKLKELMAKLKLVSPKLDGAQPPSTRN